MASTLIVYKSDNRVISTSFQDKKLCSLRPEKDNGILTGSIYVGKIMQIVPTINAAFVKVEGEENWYLPLEKCTHPITAQSHADGKLHVGDELLVQIEKEASKNKTVTVVGNYNLTGCYFVIMHGANGIHVSKKITDKEAEAKVRNILELFFSNSARSRKGFGIMLRTNAAFASNEQLTSELTYLMETYDALNKKALNVVPGTKLRDGLPNYLCELRDSYTYDFDRYVTDDISIFTQMKEFLSAFRPEEEKKLELYSDSMVSLPCVYNMEANLSELLGKKVWLKSGAYLVIEQTEAMVVVDVNSGKCTAEKRNKTGFLQVNLEAATEICRQLILRNLSGIIMIDFIDMRSQEEKNQLLEHLRKELRKDRIRSELVEMTKLNLVEVTREKTHRPLAEEFRN